MYKLLIVDDEHHIVDWLYDLFIEESGLEIDVYRAYSGIEALEWLKRTRIDVVLSDIRMPKMSGIELMNSIYKDWPKCKVIFLTGYNEFDYVYEAIKHPGVNYLLKTEDDDVIVDTVVKAIEELESEDESTDLAKQQSNLLCLMQQKETLLRIAQGDYRPDNIDQSQLDAAQIPLDLQKPVLMLLGKIYNFQESVKSVGYFNLSNKINLIIKQYLSYEVQIAQADYRHSYLLWMMQPLEMNHESITNMSHSLKLVKETLEPIQQTCEKVLGIKISFLLNNEPLNWNEIGNCFIHLDSMIEPLMGSETGIIMLQENNPNYKNEKGKIEQYGTEAVNILHEKSQLELLESYLDHGQTEDFHNTLAGISLRLSTFKSKHSSAAVEIYYSVALILLSNINRCQLSEKLSFKTGLHKLMNIDEFSSWTEASDYLLRVSNFIFELQQSEKATRNTDLFHCIKQYIESHLDGDLSLVNLAEQVNYNPSYLSRIFKQVTGNNLYIYINNVRLNKAKELLKIRNLSIYSIAKSAGFDSSQYFATVFKKKYNMTPQEYRDIHSEDK
jgi:two-component system response regulator YesN